MILYDAKQAFDCVWHDGLINKLIILSCSHYLIGLIQSFLSNRHFKDRTGNSLSDPQPVAAGVPQDLKLHSTLFNIFSYDAHLTQWYVAYARTASPSGGLPHHPNLNLYRKLTWEPWERPWTTLGIYFSRRSDSPPYTKSHKSTNETCVQKWQYTKTLPSKSTDLGVLALSYKIPIKHRASHYASESPWRNLSWTHQKSHKSKKV